MQQSNALAFSQTHQIFVAALVDTITILFSMPFNWQASKHQQLGYIASGRKQGDLTVEPAPKEFGTRIIEVRIDQ
ncbi:hypothetical protein QTN95_20700 [Vibrio sp. M260112]